MLKIWFRLLMLVGFFVVLIAAIGSFLPRSFSLRQEIQIAATVEQVFDRVNNLHQWSQWSPWRIETLGAANIQVGDPFSGTGARMRWEDPRGPGELWFQQVDEPRRIDYAFSFARFEDLRGIFSFESTENGTTLVWQCSGRLPPGPFYGYFAGLFRGEMDRQFAESLQRLKALCEAPAD
jgi:hypothetical protein